MESSHESSHELSPESSPETSPSWSQKLTAKILRRKSYKYAVTLQRGAALLLRFSVFQHDVGFSAFFHTQPSDDAKQECIEVIVCVVSPRSSRRTDTRCRRRATTTTCSWRRRRAC